MSFSAVKMQYVSALLVNGSPMLVIKLYNCGINLGSFLSLKSTQMDQPLQSVCQMHSGNSPDSGLLKLYIMFCTAATWHLKQCVAVSGVIGFLSCLFSGLYVLLQLLQGDLHSALHFQCMYIYIYIKYRSNVKICFSFTLECIHNMSVETNVERIREESD